MRLEWTHTLVFCLTLFGLNAAAAPRTKTVARDNCELVRAVMRVALPTLQKGAGKPISVGVWLEDEGRVIPFPTTLCHSGDFRIQRGTGAPGGGSFFGLTLRLVAKDSYSFDITEERKTAPNKVAVSGDVWSGAVVRSAGWVANLDEIDAGGSARLREKPLMQSRLKLKDAPRD